MGVVKAWLKVELECVLRAGTNCEPRSKSRQKNHRPKKQHVQCVEVDEARSALKINDTDSMVWCFVSTSGMNHFKNGRNPRFAALKSKTITIEDWEFSSLSILCPSFEEKKAKLNGQICILISKFSLLSGERTTTVGNPTDLGEGNRDLRAMLRTLSSPKCLVHALALGQGLTDLRDVDGILMSAPSLAISWSDVDPHIPVSSATAPASTQAAAPPAASPQRKQQGWQQRQPSAASPGGVRSPAARDAPGDAGAESGSQQQRSGGPAVDDMSQQSLGMEYEEGELEESQDMFHTQAPSAGNIFSQEAMDMRPASPTRSPTPSPPSPGVGNDQAAVVATTAAKAVAAATAKAAVAAAAAEAVAAAEAAAAVEATAAPGTAEKRASDVPALSRISLVVSRPPPVSLDQMSVGSDDGTSTFAGVQELEVTRRVTRSAQVTTHMAEDRETLLKADAKKKVIHESDEEDLWGEGGVENEEGKEEEEEEEESPDSPVPPGLTQRDVLPEDEPGENQPEGAGEGDVGDKETEEPSLKWRSGKGSAGAGPARRGRSAAAVKGKGKEKGKGEENDKGKGKGKRKAEMAGGNSGGSKSVSSQQPTEQALEQGSASEAPRSRAKGKGKRKETASAAGAASSEGFKCSPPSDEVLTPPLSGGTINSSQVSSPDNQLQLSCLTQKRQNEEGEQPGSGARAASLKCDIRRQFGRPIGASAGRNSGEGGSARGSGIGGGGNGRDVMPAPDHGKPDGRARPKKNSVYEKAAKMFPAQPLQSASLQGWKRSRPLSDVVVAVDPNWDGQGRPPIIARGYQADPVLAKWLDTVRPVKTPRTTIGGWLDRCKKDECERSRRSTGRGDGGGSTSGAR